MRLRLRSPSLFWTFAAAFLGVALLGAFLQGVVVVDLLRTLARRASGLDVVVRRVAEETAAALSHSPNVDVSGILAEHQRDLDSAVIAFRDSTGRVHYRSNAPFRFGPREGHPGREPGGGLRPPPGRPPPGRPPPNRPPPSSRAPRVGGREHDKPPPPSLAVSQEVVVGSRVVGEVVAWQLGPPRVAKVGASTRFLLMLPLALLLASVAGLVMFRNVLGRLRELQGLAGRVAEGDLEVRVPEPGADEIGQLGTALNHMAEKLAEAKCAVDKTDQERRQFFADISHELATPLTSIRGYAETLLNASIHVSSQERRHYLERIHEASQRMDLLIQDLLELNRLEAGAIGLARERIDWAALCRNTVESFEARFQEAGLELR